MTITFQEKCPVFSVVSQPQSSAPQNPAPNSHPYPSDSFAPTQHPPYPTPGITTPYPYSTSQMMPQPQPSGTAYTPYPSTAQPGYQPPYPPVNRFSTPSVDSLTHDAHQVPFNFDKSWSRKGLNFLRLESISNYLLFYYFQVNGGGSICKSWNGGLNINMLFWSYMFMRGFY